LSKQPSRKSGADIIVGRDGHASFKGLGLI